MHGLLGDSLELGVYYGSVDDPEQSARRLQLCIAAHPWLGTVQAPAQCHQHCVFELFSCLLCVDCTQNMCESARHQRRRGGGCSSAEHPRQAIKWRRTFSSS